jgi:glutathionylspermidine synthase
MRFGPPFYGFSHSNELRYTNTATKIVFYAPASTSFRAKSWNPREHGRVYGSCDFAQDDNNGGTILECGGLTPLSSPSTTAAKA